MTDPEKLRLLAKWFDEVYPMLTNTIWKNDDVQQDLRRIAKNLEGYEVVNERPI